MFLSFPSSPDLPAATPEPCRLALRCSEEEKDLARRARAATRAAVSVCGRADSPQQTQVCCCERCPPCQRQQNVSVANISKCNTARLFSPCLATFSLEFHFCCTQNVSNANMARSESRFSSLRSFVPTQAAPAGPKRFPSLVCLLAAFPLNFLRI